MILSKSFEPAFSRRQTWSAVTCHRCRSFGVPPSGGRVNAELRTKAPFPMHRDSAGALQIYPFTNFIATPFMQ